MPFKDDDGVVEVRNQRSATKLKDDSRIISPMVSRIIWNRDEPEREIRAIGV